MSIDVTIVGGGLVGCLTALRLSLQGQKCAIIDGRELLRGASVNNAGGLYFQTQPQATTFDVVQTRKLAELAVLIAASRDAWNRLQHLLHGSCGLVWSGGMIVADDDAGMARLQSKQMQEADWGIPTEILSSDDVRRLLPHITPEIRGAVFSKYEGFCETSVLAAAVRQALDRAGVEVCVGKAVVSVTMVGKIFRLKLADEMIFESPVLVGCLGAFMDDLLIMLGLSSGMIHLPLQIHDMEAPKGVVPLFTRYEGGRLSLKQHSSGRVIVGGGWPAKPHQDDSMAVLMSLESRCRNIELAGRIIPVLAQSRCTAWRGGWAAWTLDGLPTIGGYASLPNFYTAFGGNGFTLAPLYAEILVSLVQREQPLINLTAFSPERFSVGSIREGLPPDG